MRRQQPLLGQPAWERSAVTYDLDLRLLNVAYVDAGDELRRFLGPVYDSLIEKRQFTLVWPASGDWRPGIQARTGEEGP